VRAVVTGAAGFIGSTLVDTLVADGHDVVGIDCFTPYYDAGAKRANVAGASAMDRFRLVEADLGADDLGPLVEGADVVFHQAAQPGVRLSWAEGFADYDRHNVLATQRLLEAAKAARVGRVVYASSSSVYGNAPRYPTTEDDLPRPHSPYGVTKLAAEHLCGLYAANWGVPTVSLRYFTVYGPRQRPDMAMHRMCESVLTDEPFPLFGTGEQVRDFTFVRDVVGANLAAATADVAPGTVCNVAGGGSISMLELFTLLGDIAGTELRLDRQPSSAGDVERTGGTIDRAERLLGWSPEVDVREGLAAQLDWHRARREGGDLGPAGP
jgi:UDP-glucuronate 4-epimerase